MTTAEPLSAFDIENEQLHILVMSTLPCLYQLGVTVRCALLSGFCHVSQLFTATSPIAPEVLALLPLPPPHLPSEPPYPEVTLAEVVTAIKCLENNKPPRVCNKLPEMLKYGVASVHSAVQSHPWHFAHSPGLQA